MQALTVEVAVAEFGALAKAKLDNPSATGEPEDQLRAPFELLLSRLAALAGLKPAHVVPAHGKLGDATLIARDREFLMAVQARVGELKKAGKTVDEAIAAVVAEIAPKYPEWGNPTGAGAVARAAFAEAK